MRRRDVIAFLGGIAATWPVSAHADESGMRLIGILMPMSAGDPSGPDRVLVFRQALQELGWIEGRNVRIEVLWADEPDIPKQRELLQKYSEKLVALAPDVILAGGGLAVAPLQRATRKVPIVFTATVNPVGFGYVASLARPGGNTTGFINIEFSFSAKYLELLKQIAPAVTRAGVLRPPGFPSQLAVIVATAPSLQVEVSPLEMIDADEIERAIAAFAAKPNGGLVVTVSTPATVYSKLIIALAAQYRLPTVYPNRFHVVAGGLVSYGPVFLDQYRRAADYVDRILKGGNPGDLPVQAPTKFEMALNLKTAKALGLAVPRAVLARADEIID